MRKTASRSVNPKFDDAFQKLLHKLGLESVEPNGHVAERIVVTEEFMRLLTETRRLLGADIPPPPVIRRPVARLAMSKGATMPRGKMGIKELIRHAEMAVSAEERLQTLRALNMRLRSDKSAPQELWDVMSSGSYSMTAKAFAEEALRYGGHPAENPKTKGSKTNGAAGVTVLLDGKPVDVGSAEALLLAVMATKPKQKFTNNDLVKQLFRVENQWRTTGFDIRFNTKLNQLVKKGYLAKEKGDDQTAYFQIAEKGMALLGLLAKTGRLPDLLEKQRIRFQRKIPTSINFNWLLADDKSPGRV